VKTEAILLWTILRGMHTTVPPVIEDMAADGALRCPHCRGRLEASGDALLCARCRTPYRAFNGVVDLFGLVGSGTGVDPAPAVAIAGPVMHALELHDDDAPAVRDILARTALVTSSNAEFDAEIRDLADRFGIEAEPDSAPLATTRLHAPPDPLGLVVDRHYVPASIAPSMRLTCNVRFRNAGTRTLFTSSEPPVTVGFRWFDSLGSLVPLPEHRTRFPIDIVAGRAITLPVDIVTPDEPGTYTLLTCPVVEHQRWATECGIAIPVQVGPARGIDSAMLDLQPDASPCDYATDHEVAREMLGEAIASLPHAAVRLLEIGGGAAPQSSWFGVPQVVNVDINLPLLELGALYYARNAPANVAESVAFLCADANNLPFEDETFDVVVMFSTLHHFAAPEALLAECRRVVRHDGIVAVLCEPVSSTLEADVTLRDLRKGINEQVFTVPEYLRIFAAAGLEPVGGNEIGGSLRVFMRPIPPSGERFDHSGPGVELPPRDAAFAATITDGGRLHRFRDLPTRVYRGIVRRIDGRVDN
jgi:SAM-dependent methyltransferase